MDAGKIGTIAAATTYKAGEKPPAAAPEQSKAQMPTDGVNLSGKVNKVESPTLPKNAEYVPGELLVRFKGEAPASFRFQGVEMKLVKNFDLPQQMRPEQDSHHQLIDHLFVMPH